jgi:flagellar hook-associated protein 2
MSDITIPGVTSKFNSQKIIEDLMKLERIPLTRMEESVTTLSDQKKVWQDLNRQFSSLQDSSKSMYGFQNPFNDRNADSSDPDVLTATATREALSGENKIKVIEVAASDRFLSKSLSEDFSVPEGKYTFRIGDDEIEFTFRGGSLKKFADTINRKDDDLLQAKIVKDTSQTQVLLLESQKEGSENPLILLDKASDFGVEAGMIEKTLEEQRNIILNEKSLKKWTIPIDYDLVGIEQNTLTLNPGSEVSIAVQPAFPVTDDIMLELEYNVIYMKENIWVAPSPPPGPEIPDVEGITLEGVTVRGSSSKVILPEWEAPEPPQRIDDMGFLFVQEGRDAVPLPELQDTGNFQKLSIKLADYLDNINALNIRNRNTYREIQIKNIRIFNPMSRGDFLPVRAISRASDAKLELDGIEVKRGSNSIDDLIPGVTLNLQDVHAKEVTLSIQPDTEAVKDSIIALIGNYNRIITNLNILIRTDSTLIDEIDYFTDEEREKAEEQLGLFQGDITLNQLRSSLQNIMMNAYTTEEGRNFSLLSHMGISTNAGGTERAGGVDVTRLRGYLEINEEVLDQALDEHFSSIKELFGRDSDSDLVIDSGVAYVLDSQLKPFVQTGGILSMKNTTIDSQIRRNNREISNYNEYLERYEQDLRRKYGMMEGAIESMEQSSQAIDNFSNSNRSY